MSAAAVFGPTTPLQSNWAECAVRIDNEDAKPLKGTVELTSSSPYPVESKLTTRAPFAVGPGSVVTVRLPTRGFAGGGGPLDLRVVGDGGQELASSTVTVAGALSPMLVDLSDPPRLAGALRDVPVAVSYDPTGGALPRSHSSGKVAISTGSARTDPATGDPVLPDRAAGYASTTVVVMRTDQLARLKGMELDALSGFVLTGGTLALVVARPEDLRNATLDALVGGEVSSAPAPKQLATIAGIAPEEPGTTDGDPAPRRRFARPSTVLPSDDIAKSLAGFSGGNLRQTMFGASASYGMGEVHLLAFDPTQPPGVDDPWVRSRMVDLVQHAWDRRAYTVNEHAALMAPSNELRSVHKALDPNEGGRWAIVVAAVLLIAYSVVAGPVNFARAAKRGRPLRALWQLPIYSALVFLSVVVMGIAAKGWRGQARHLTFVEALPGMSRAGALRFRGFFTSDSRTLTVRATDLGSVLDEASEGRGQTGRSLLVDRDGVTLQGLATMPWETVVVREDGFANLGAGVSVVPQPGGDLTITNRSAHDLRAVLVVMPSSTPSKRVVHFFPRIKDGQSTKASEGKVVAFTPWATSSKGLTDYDVAPIKRDLEGESRGLASAWLAIGEATSAYADWWPDDVPVVLAQMDGGEGMTRDGGLRMDQDRVLIRLVGYGGVP